MAAHTKHTQGADGGSRPIEEESFSVSGDKTEFQKSGSKKKRTWRIVLVVALVVLVVAIGVLAYIGYTYWIGQKDYDDIASEVFVAPEYAEDVVSSDDLDLGAFSINWDMLYAINPDVVGWIYIPDTRINYPIAHIDGDDEYYLKHNFSRSSAGQFGAEYGCIMLSGVNSADFSDRVNVIYGHNMANGSMFALLSQFHDSDIFNAHRTIYLFTPTGSYRLKSFAVNRVLGSDTSIVVPNFATDDEFVEYVQKRLDNSIVSANSELPSAESVSKVFALSTCDGADNTYRYITFCSIDEYLPIGASVTQDFIDESNALDVESSTQERIS